MIAGGCRCGAVRYTIARDSLPRCYACHCHICQRATGSAFSVQVPEATLSVEGPLDIVEVATDDRVSVRRYCALCHARVYNTNSARPGIAVVRAGTLDHSEEVACRAHIFTAYRQRWVTIADVVPSWPEAPPPHAFIAAMTAPRIP